MTAPVFEGGFTQIPARVIRDGYLARMKAEASLYVALCYCRSRSVGAGGRLVRVGFERLAQLVGKSTRWIGTYVARLVGMGLLEVMRAPDGRRCGVYRLVEPPQPEHYVSDTIDTRSASRAPAAQKRHPRGDKSVARLRYPSGEVESPSSSPPLEQPRIAERQRDERHRRQAPQNPEREAAAAWIARKGWASRARALRLLASSPPSVAELERLASDAEFLASKGRVASAPGYVMAQLIGGERYRRPREVLEQERAERDAAERRSAADREARERARREEREHNQRTWDAFEADLAIDALDDAWVLATAAELDAGERAWCPRRLTGRPVHELRRHPSVRSAAVRALSLAARGGSGAVPA